MYLFLRHTPEVDGLTPEQTRHLISVVSKERGKRWRQGYVAFIAFQVPFFILQSAIVVMGALERPSVLAFAIPLFLAQLCALVFLNVVAWLVIVERVMRPAMRRERQRMVEEAGTDERADSSE